MESFISFKTQLDTSNYTLSAFHLSCYLGPKYFYVN